jgi:3-deoxy-D-manno-octulosonic-acid transferase
VVFLETEIWPIWLCEAHRFGAKTALINGRISVRSVQAYTKLRPFFRAVLRNIDAFSMILNEDARRIIDMGADPRRIVVNGNAKVDSLAGRDDPSVEKEVRHALNLQPSQPVFIAGSTREGEEEIVLKAYEKVLRRFPDTLLIIAPRHVRRTPAIVSLLRDRGFRYQLRTDMEGPGARRTAPVVVINTWGELFRLYSVGTINFCGASLVPLGGQNPLEAAVWGKVVLYGPSMEDFKDAKRLLESVGAGIEISGAKSLTQKALWLLDHPEALATLGERARQLIKRNQGAALKHARVIEGLLQY